MKYVRHGMALCAFLCLVACASTQNSSGTGGVAEDSGTSEHWQYIVDKYVVGDYFDYAALAKSNRDRQTLDKHMQWQAETDVKSWPRESQIAFYINAYNSACVKTIVDHYPVHSPMDIDGFFDGIKFKVAGEELTISAIEYDRLIADYKDMRAHFAVVCSDRGCLPLRSEAYTGDKLNEMLEERAKSFVSDERQFKVDMENKKIEISKIFFWYGEKFTQDPNLPAEKPEQYLKYWAPADVKKVLESGDYEVVFKEWDWTINEKHGAKAKPDSTDDSGKAAQDSSERSGKDRWGKDTRTFKAVNSFTLEVPEGAGKVRAWFAMPQESNADQEVSGWKVECEHATKTVKDRHGNEFLLLELNNPKAGNIEIKTSFTLKRHEVNMPTDPARTRPHTEAELSELDKYLKEQNQGKVTDDIRAMAKKVVGDEKNPLKVGRLLYDALIDHVQYWVIDPDNLKSSGSGSATYTYEQCTGNCTDFHGLYHALCMAVNLPCRTVYGGFFKGPLDGKDQDQSYHCWIEIHAPNLGWVPLDVSIADLYAQEITLTDANREKVNLTLPDGYHGKDMKLVDYYYGNLDARRVVWHEHRDLEIGQDGDAVNFLPWFYVEVDGKPEKIAKRKLTFTEVK